jgi:uncharacterized DUF497 family protein
MDFDFDPNKDRFNQEKHGISLSEAAYIEWDTALEKLDDRDDYGEDRYRAFGFIGNRLYCVVYVDRNEVRRVISLRKANAREVGEYVKASQ